MLSNISLVRCGYSSGVERNLAKVDVVGSNPIARSIKTKTLLYGAFFVLKVSDNGFEATREWVHQEEQARRKYRCTCDDEAAKPNPIARSIKTKTLLYGAFFVGNGIASPSSSKVLR